MPFIAFVVQQTQTARQVPAGSVRLLLPPRPRNVVHSVALNEHGALACQRPLSRARRVVTWKASHTLGRTAPSPDCKGIFDVQLKPRDTATDRPRRGSTRVVLQKRSRGDRAFRRHLLTAPGPRRQRFQKQPLFRREKLNDSAVLGHGRAPPEELTDAVTSGAIWYASMCRWTAQQLPPAPFG